MTTTACLDRQNVITACTEAIRHLEGQEFKLLPEKETKIKQITSVLRLAMASNENTIQVSASDFYEFGGFWP